MTTNEYKMSWLQFYLAVKRGDVETVKKATDKDFRIPLAMNKSAIELAALYGHRNLVEYWLEKFDEKTKEQGLLHKVLVESLLGGHCELAKTLMDIPGSADPEDTLAEELLSAAINGKNIDCLELMWKFMEVTDTDYRWEYAWHAFSTGSSEMTDSVHEFLVPRFPNPHYCSSMKFPPVYIDIALGHYRPGLDYSLSDKKKGFKHRLTTHNQYQLEKFTVLDAAGYFGRLNVLKLLIKEMHQMKDVDIKALLQSALKFALRKNHAHVVKYLVEEHLVDPLPPYEYEGFVMNEAFEYLRQNVNFVPKDISECLRKNIVNNLHVLQTFQRLWVHDTGIMQDSESEWCTYSTLLEDRSLMRLTKMDEYYEYILNTWSTKIGERDMRTYFLKALSEQNVDAALCFQKRLRNHNVDCWPEYHELIKDVMTLPDPRFDIMTSPVIAEIFLASLNGAVTCGCHLRMCPLKQFLRGPRWVDVEQLAGRMPRGVPAGELAPHVDVDTVVQRASIVLQILFQYGIPKPNSKVIADFVKEIFAWSCFSSVTFGKLLSLLQCCRVNLDEIKVTRINPAWFMSAWEWSTRHAYLTRFLVALGRNAIRGRISVDYMLVYIFDSEERKNHYLNVFRQAAIVVDDSQFGKPGPGRSQYLRQEEISAFKTSLTEIWHSVPPLQDMARYKLHSHLLNVAHQSALFISVETLIDELNRESLPQRLHRYMKFQDVYERLPRAMYAQASEEIPRLAYDRRFQRYIRAMYREGQESDSDSDADESDEDDE